MFLRGILTATIKRVRFWHLRSTAIIQTELFQGKLTCTLVLSITLNSFQSTSISIRLTIQQKVDKINSFLTCLPHVPFRGMAAGFLSCRWIFIALHSVKIPCSHFPSDKLFLFFVFVFSLLLMLLLLPRK